MHSDIFWWKKWVSTFKYRTFCTTRFHLTNCCLNENWRLLKTSRYNKYVKIYEFYDFWQNLLKKIPKNSKLAPKMQENTQKLHPESLTHHPEPSEMQFPWLFFNSYYQKGGCLLVHLRITDHFLNFLKFFKNNYFFKMNCYPGRGPNLPLQKTWQKRFCCLKIQQCKNTVKFFSLLSITFYALLKHLLSVNAPKRFF